MSFRAGRHKRPAVLVAIVGALLATLPVNSVLGARAQGAEASRCEGFASSSAQRAAIVTGAGERIVVVGDSWSAGLGLSWLGQSWPSRLEGRVHVAGFSGSGFSAKASPCGRVSFADRAPKALAGGADLVVVEGGLNDYDRSTVEITVGFARLMRTTSAYRTVIVGPAVAPSRASRVSAVDRLLRRLSEQYDVAYISTLDLNLPYLRDRLHLTAAGHRIFGAAIAARITDLN